MSLTRRRFLQNSSAVAFGVGLPEFFRRAALAAPDAAVGGSRETILVVVELTGGNDGLNTVIPFRDPAYAAARPTLKQPAATIRKIDEELGFHPSMQAFSKLLEDSKLAIVQGVGYPNPNRSHFESMDIWHKATAAREQQYGWLGRTAPRLEPGGAMHVGGGEPPLALFGTSGHAPSLHSLEQYQLRVGGDEARKRAIIEKQATVTAGGDDLLQFVRSSARQTYASAERLREVAKSYETPISYPGTGLGSRLKLIAQLIDAGVPERVYYTSHGGFDTHAAQQEIHARLLQEFSEAVAAFVEDVSHHGHGRRVLVLTFSEFGRRVRENGSQGTDHGVASQMFLVGDTVKPGLIGEHPSLTDLDSGDLKFHTDFRSVYATVLDEWLGVRSTDVLGGEYPRVDLLARG